MRDGIALLAWALASQERVMISPEGDGYGLEIRRRLL